MTDLDIGLNALKRVQQYFPEAILAGGFLRDLQLGVQPKGIDVFIPLPDADTLLAFLLGTDAEIQINATSYMERGEVHCVYELPGSEYPVQVIILREGLSPAERVKHHDFGICQVWHDGTVHHSTAAYLDDVMDNTFTLVHCEDQREFDRSMRRWERLRHKYPGWKLRIPDEFEDYRQMELDLR